LRPIVKDIFNAQAPSADIFTSIRLINFFIFNSAITEIDPGNAINISTKFHD
jgi:hypothetical protein